MKDNNDDYVNRHRGDDYKLNFSDSLLFRYDEKSRTLEKLVKSGKNEEAIALEKEIAEIRSELEISLRRLNIEGNFDREKYRDILNSTGLTITDDDEIEITSAETPVTANPRKILLQPPKLVLGENNPVDTPNIAGNFDASTPLSSKKNIKTLNLRKSVFSPTPEDAIEEIKAHLSADIKPEIVQNFFNNEENKQKLNDTLNSGLGFLDVINYCKKIFLQKQDSIHKEGDYKEEINQTLNSTELPFTSACNTFLDKAANAENNQINNTGNRKNEGLLVKDNTNNNRDSNNGDNNNSDNKNSDTEDMAPQVKGISIKDALELIPRFDGKNLQKFLDGCEEALSILPTEQEKELAKLVRIRISGDALNSIRGLQFSTIAELGNYFDKIFGSTKTFHDWEGELARIRQRKDETVIVYYNRLREIENEILKAAAREKRVEDEDVYNQKLEKDCIKFFLKGLRWEIRARIGKPDKLKDALEEALEIEREYACSMLDGDTEGEERRVKFSKETKRVHFVDEEVPIKCSHCQIAGHTVSNCLDYTRKLIIENKNNYFRNLRNSDQNFDGWNTAGRRRIPFLPSNQGANRVSNAPSSISSNNNSNRSNHFNNRNSNTNYGNNNNGNFNRQNFNNNRNFNNRHNVGNNQRNFNNSNNENNNTRITNDRSALTCYYCGKTGHIRSNCFKYQNDMRRREAQGQGNDHALSHMGARRENTDVSRPTARDTDSLAMPALKQ